VAKYLPAWRSTLEPHDIHIGHRWPENPFLRRLVYAALAVWLLAAMAPHDRGDWLLENLLVFVAVGGLVAGYRRLPLSNLSYGLLFVFGVLHAVGSHYTYSLAPPGFWIQELFALDRNPYDRIVHFAFGLLLTYPFRELTRRVLHAHGAWSYAIPLFATLSISAGYEILEALAARVVDPELGIAFVGAQGDPWDAQKDMALALWGALLCLAATAGYRARTGREPWGLLAPR